MGRREKKTRKWSRWWMQGKYWTKGVKRRACNTCSSLGYSLQRAKWQAPSDMQENRSKGSKGGEGSLIFEYPFCNLIHDNRSTKKKRNKKPIHSVNFEYHTNKQNSKKLRKKVLPFLLEFNFLSFSSFSSLRPSTCQHYQSEMQENEQPAGATTPTGVRPRLQTVASNEYCPRSAWNIGRSTELGAAMLSFRVWRKKKKKRERKNRCWLPLDCWLGLTGLFPVFLCCRKSRSFCFCFSCHR